MAWSTSWACCSALPWRFMRWMPATVISTARRIALSAQATFWAPCICSAISAMRRRSSSGSPNRPPNGSSSDMQPMLEGPDSLLRLVGLPQPDFHSTCLVTGASSGIGADVARSLARRGHGTTLVARRAERLEELATELRDEHGVRVEVIEADLADEAGRESMTARLAELTLNVEVLVNNAGFGSGGLFVELDPEREREMVRLNVETVIALCGKYVPEMVRRGRGGVLNVASTAAFQPLPRQATYGATKAFVLSFTEALHSDLSDTGVTATALCPGPVKTEFVDVAGMNDAADGTPSFVWMSAEDTARAGVRGLERGKRVVVPGALNRATTISGQHTPRAVLLPIVRRFYPLGK